MNDTNQKEVTKQISVITMAILIAFCSLLFKCSYGNNQYASNYHKAVEVCKNDIACIKCFVVATDAGTNRKECAGAK